MNRVVTICCLFCAALTIGCVSTRVTSAIDPLHRDSSYSRLLVIGNYSNLELVKISEQKMVEVLNDKGVFAVSNYDILPPLRAYTEAEKQQAYARYHFDAYITISPAGDSSESYYTPGMTTTSADVSHRHDGFTGTTTTSASASTSTIPGQYKKTSYYDTRIELYAMGANSIICRCDANTSQDSSPGAERFSGTGSRMSSICSNVANELEKNKLLRKNPDSTKK